MSTPSFIKELSIPAIAAPMFLISGPKLVIECCKNGIVGTFPALNQRTSEGFEEWLIEIKTALSDFEKETGTKPAPFGVNLIVHQSNPRVQADLMLCVKHQVPIIITSLGAVPQLVDAVHSYGGLVFHDVIKRRHAEKASEAGVDGLIVVAAGAGGHAGTINPMPLVAYLTSIGLNFEHLNYKDHHDFSESEEELIYSKSLVLTTEKDFSRLNTKAHNGLFYLPIQLIIDRAEKFESLVTSYVKQYDAS